jgi:hypothetical protein
MCSRRAYDCQIIIKQREQIKAKWLPTDRLMPIYIVDMMRSISLLEQSMIHDRLLVINKL